jgi:hypothetical protein
VESEGPRTEQGGNQKQPPSNVVRLRRDRLGPPDEPGDHETVGSIREWLGDDEPFVPVTGTNGDTSVRVPTSGSSFWGEDALAMHDAIAAPAPREPDGDIASEVPSAPARRAARPKLTVSAAAAWLAIACLGLGAIEALRSVLGPSTPPSAGIHRTAPKGAQAAVPNSHRPPAPKPTRSHPRPARRKPSAPKRHTNAPPPIVEARYSTPPSSSGSSQSASPPTQQAAPASSAPANSTESSGHAASTPSQPAGPTGAGALTGAGTTPSG